jgi:hypothetical protein
MAASRANWSEQMTADRDSGPAQTGTASSGIGRQGTQETQEDHGQAIL